MKKATVFVMFFAVTLFFATSGMAGSDSEKSQIKPDSAKCPMMKQSGDMKGKCHQKCKMAGQKGFGKMMVKMVATEDEGIVVMIGNKLYKYDKDLNFVNEAEIPVDYEQMKKMMMKMYHPAIPEEGEKTAEGE